LFVGSVAGDAVIFEDGKDGLLEIQRGGREAEGEEESEEGEKAPHTS
jgi:hypothetical protein